MEAKTVRTYDEIVKYQAIGREIKAFLRRAAITQTILKNTRRTARWKGTRIDAERKLRINKQRISAVQDFYLAIQGKKYEHYNPEEGQYWKSYHQHLGLLNNEIKIQQITLEE